MTYKIEIPDNPADKGITRLEGEDALGRTRTLEWITGNPDDMDAWYVLNLTTGKPTKGSRTWRDVLEEFTNVREPADPTADVKREVIAELQGMLNLYVNQEANDSNDRGCAGGVLADAVRAYLDRLEK